MFAIFILYNTHQINSTSFFLVDRWRPKLLRATKNVIDFRQLFSHYINSKIVCLALFRDWIKFRFRLGCEWKISIQRSFFSYRIQCRIFVYASVNSFFFAISSFFARFPPFRIWNARPITIEEIESTRTQTVLWSMDTALKFEEKKHECWWSDDYNIDLASVRKLCNHATHAVRQSQITLTLLLCEYSITVQKCWLITQLNYIQFKT